MIQVLKVLVLISLASCFLFLALMVIRTFRFGSRKFYAHQQGNIRKGIIYAFGRGMLPWEKESASRHLPTYIAGIFYHSGIFLAFAYLFARMLDLKYPVLLKIPVTVWLIVAFSAGFFLLAKRSFSQQMKAISCPDDYIANILVDGFLCSALVDVAIADFSIVMYAVATLLLLYIPVGKIRHCFFFFYTRILFGIFFGRRRVFPPQKKIRTQDE